jgi:cell division protein FtsQ
VRAAGPGASGARRRPKRDTPRPSGLTRERGSAGRSNGTPPDRRFGRINRAERGSRFPNGDHDKPTLRSDRGSRAAQTRAATPQTATAQTVVPRPPAIRTGWPWLVAGVGVLALAGALTWVLLGSSLFDTRSVQVAGTRELPAAVVRTVAAVPLGTPMLRLDSGAIETRVAAIPRVASAQVRCNLDGTVRIEVTERSPVAVVHRGNDVHLVDATGTDYAAVAAGPPGLPELRVARVGPRDTATVAALMVLTALPDWLRVQVRSIAAKSPSDVVLSLDNKREINWGGVEDADRKAAVIGPLLSQPGKVYDVSSPTLPTIA